MGLELQKEAGELRTYLRDIQKDSLTPLEINLGCFIQRFKVQTLEGCHQKTAHWPILLVAGACRGARMKGGGLS